MAPHVDAIAADWSEGRVGPCWIGPEQPRWG